MKLITAIFRDRQSEYRLFWPWRWRQCPTTPLWEPRISHCMLIFTPQRFTGRTEDVRKHVGQENRASKTVTPSTRHKRYSSSSRTGNITVKEDFGVLCPEQTSVWWWWVTRLEMWMNEHNTIPLLLFFIRKWDSNSWSFIIQRLHVLLLGTP